MEPHRNRMLPHFEPGDCVGGRYRIAAPIGRGGMGSVYLAEDIRLQGKLRALKLTAAQPGERDAFIREASLLSALSHPLLPDIVDYFPPGDDGMAVIVMDYVPGESLGERFAKSGRRLPFPRVRHYLEQLGEALCYLHAQRPQIVFRDLKPANVMIDQHDHAILVDFGIARPYRPEATADTQRLGTPAFAAPEQIAGRQTDARSDLYSWGALAFYLLSEGQAAIRHPAGRHARLLQDDVPAAFRDLLDETLAEEPDARPRSADELLGRLRRASAPQLPYEAEPREAEPNRHGRGKRETGVSVVAVLSAYPGAGATLATLGLSRLLSEEGVHHAVAECPGGEPEWHALLNGDRDMPAHAAFADPAGTGPVAPVWRRGTAAYYPMDPKESGARMPEERFSAWLHRLGVPVVLLDVSSRWLAAGVADALAACGLQSIWWVADCLPAKWSPRLQREAADLHAKLAGEGAAAAGWIANRDHGFAQRGDWLACFPAAPVACIPWLPAEDIVQAAWRGEGFPARSLSAGHRRSAFRKWADRAGLLLPR